MMGSSPFHTKLYRVVLQGISSAGKRFSRHARSTQTVVLTNHVSHPADECGVSGHALRLMIAAAIGLVLRCSTLDGITGSAIASSVFRCAAPHSTVSREVRKRVPVIWD